MTERKHPPIKLIGIAMFALAALFYLYEFILQVSPSIMTAALRRDFNIGSGMIGLIAGAYFYSYTLMQIPAGLLYSRLGAKRVIFSALLFCVAGAFIFSIAPSPWISFFARFLMGLGSACAYLGILEITTRWIPTAYFAIFAGVAQGLGSLGAVVGEAPLASAVNHLGWRHSFMALTVLGGALAVLILLFLRDNPSGTVHATDRVHKHSPLATLLIVMKKPQNWLVALFALCIWTPVPIFASLWGVPYLIQKYHITNVTAGGDDSLVWIGIALGGPTAGYFAYLLKKPSLVLASYVIIGIIASCLTIYLDLNIHLEVICLFFMGLASGAQALTFGYVERNNSKHIAGAAFGLNNMAIVLGGAIFQPVVGWILNSLWSGGMQNGIKHYQLSSYQVALTSIPCLFIAALIILALFIREPAPRKAS